MKQLPHNQNGFTLVETLVAILILSMTVGALLTLAAGGFFSVRYARNDIVANNLAQESLEYLRNSRDTLIAQGGTWDEWKNLLTADESGSITGDFGRGCFSDTGCIVDPYTVDPAIRECRDQCENITYFSSHGFYGYEVEYTLIDGERYPTTYIRKIYATETDPNQVIVTAQMTWLNGTSTKTTSQSTMLTKWTP